MRLFLRNDFCSFITMKRPLLFSLFFTMLLTSCFFADDIFDPPTPKEPTLQELSEKSIQEYLQAKTEFTYMPYGFNTIKIVKPIEIVEVEKLEEQKRNQGYSNAELDSSIAKKRRFIEAKQIERTIVVDHFFTFTDSLKNTIVYETQFTLNDTLGVKNVQAKIKQEIEPDYVSILSFFFYEKPIFLATSFQESKLLSQNFYAFFKEELERKKDLFEKSEFLLHALKITREVKIKGEFQQQEVLERFVKRHMDENRPDIEEYKSLLFSDLFQTNKDDSDEILGYYFFHKFIGEFKEVTDTNVVLIEFTPYYEIDQIYQMDRPFAPYFKN